MTSKLQIFLVLSIQIVQDLGNGRGASRINGIWVQNSLPSGKQTQSMSLCLCTAQTCHMHCYGQV